MQKLSIIMVLSLLIITGCAQKPPKREVLPAHEASSQPTVTPTATVEMSSQPGDSNRAVRMQECRKELEAMQVYSKSSYDKYMSQVQKLTAAINKYREVEPSISAELNDIMLPQTEFHMRELCFRIKSQLMQLMVKS